MTPQEHAQAVRTAMSAFNVAIANAERDGVKVRYAKGEQQKGGYNGPLTLQEVVHVIVSTSTNVSEVS